ncbi:MAG: hypothetical protein OEY01_10695 [Desulfobulbaceae bacterium]|nr:hypothetical protein [Desulfobulbaceae bacterium]
MRSFRGQHNLVAVSAGSQETGINTEQTLDLSLLVSMSDIANLEPRRESNADELTGKEEPDAVYDLGATSGIPFNFEKAQPQHFAFLLAYGLGSISSAAAGTGYEHTITPIAAGVDADRDLPTFTVAQRYGKTVLKRRFASMAIETISATFAKDTWVKITGQAKGTGKVTDNVASETIAAAGNVTELTLAANGVEGADAATRLDNVQRIRVELTAGVWTEVTYSAVSAATPAVITIAAPGGDVTVVNYEVLYIPTESGWMVFPSRVTETPLRVSELTVMLGGAWNGTTFAGGRELTSEIKSVDWTINNGVAAEFVPGAGGAYASRISRDSRTQTIKLTREFREMIMQQHIAANDTFGVHILAEGAIFDDPHKYQVELIFPLCAVLTAPLSVDGKRLAEAGDLVVLEDGTYGSVIAKVKNLQAAYAA